jgi:hypothetical protein
VGFVSQWKVIFHVWSTLVYQIREIVMDSHSDEETHYACEEVMWQDNSYNPVCVWALPPKPQRRVVHTFTWGVQREKQWSCPHNERVYSSQRSFVLCGNNYFAGCGDKSILWPVLTKFWRQTISPTWGDRSGIFLRFWLWHYTWDIQFKAGFGITGWKWSSSAPHSTD